MASKNQETVQNTAASPDALGRAKALFGTSPILSEELTPSERRATYLELLNSTVQNGHGFSEGVDLNYPGAPDFTDVPEGAASPFLPNPTSPGEGNGANPNAKPESDSFTCKQMIYIFLCMVFWLLMIYLCGPQR